MSLRRYQVSWRIELINERVFVNPPRQEKIKSRNEFVDDSRHDEHSSNDACKHDFDTDDNDRAERLPVVSVAAQRYDYLGRVCDSCNDALSVADSEGSSSTFWLPFLVVVFIPCKTSIFSFARILCCDVSVASEILYGSESSSADHSNYCHGADVFDLLVALAVRLSVLNIRRSRERSLRKSCCCCEKIEFYLLLVSICAYYPWNLVSFVVAGGVCCISIHQTDFPIRRWRGGVDAEARKRHGRSAVAVQLLHGAVENESYGFVGFFFAHRLSRFCFAPYVDAFFLRIKRGVLQYVAIKPVVAILTVIFHLTHL